MVRDAIRVHLTHEPMKQSKSRIKRLDVIVGIHGRPAAVLIGFPDEADWLEYRLLKDERFLARVSKSRQQHKERRYQTLEELP